MCPSKTSIYTIEHQVNRTHNRAVIMGLIDVSNHACTDPAIRERP